MSDVIGAKHSIFAVKDALKDYLNKSQSKRPNSMKVTQKHDH